MPEPTIPVVEAAPSSVNSIIAKALEESGVPAKNISLPPVTEPPAINTPGSPDSLPLPPVKGQQVVEGATQPPVVEPASPAPDEPIVPGVASKADIETAIAKATGNLQSIMDRKLNLINAQMTNTIGALNQFFQTQEDTSISGLPESEQITKRLERLEKPAAPKIQIANVPVDQQPSEFYQQLVNFVDAVGFKIDDKRIDWAGDTNDPKAGFARFLVSIKTALLEDQKNVIEELKKNGTKEIAKLRKKTGVDAVPGSGPAGAGLPDVNKLSAMEKIELGFQQQEAAA